MKIFIFIKGEKNFKCHLCCPVKFYSEKCKLRWVVRLYCTVYSIQDEVGCTVQVEVGFTVQAALGCTVQAEVGCTEQAEVGYTVIMYNLRWVVLYKLR